MFDQLLPPLTGTLFFNRYIMIDVITTTLGIYIKNTIIIIFLIEALTISNYIMNFNFEIKNWNDSSKIYWVFRFSNFHTICHIIFSNI